MPTGLITKGIGGFYYVKYDNTVVECKARGKLRRNELPPMVGDNVLFEYTSQNRGVITEIFERSNYIIRPPAANIDQAVVVLSVSYPEPNFLFLDKLITILESKNINIVICINKVDLDENHEYRAISEIYNNIGYKVLSISAKNNIGIENVLTLLENRISVLAGSSGVGKSSLLNAIHNEVNVKTGELSAKVERGKHTTRHVELFELPHGGYILDTPGFSMLEVNNIPPSELKYYYKEFCELNSNCRFKQCIHINEPDCAVKNAVSENIINKSRYMSYVSIYNELKSKTQYK